MKEKINYSLKDISVIIATYNRYGDLAITINSFKKYVSSLKEVIIIDQSTNDLTKETVKELRERNIKYFHSKTPSLTLARNLGVDKSSKKAKITLFLDDDVFIGRGYFEGILEVFNVEKGVVGVAGHYFQNIKVNRFANFARKIFLIEHRQKNSVNVYSPYGASYPTILTKTINASWLPGFNMAFKKEVFETNKFDENFFKYGLGEDFEFTTRLNKKYPNSLFITPFAKIVHRVSEAERMPKPKLVYMNHVNKLYIQKKNFNTFEGIVSTGIALLIISIMHLFIAISNPTNKNLLKCGMHFKSLFYCLRRLNLIRKGDLTIPSNV